MFNPFRQKDEALEEAIAAVYEEMKVLTSDDDAYDDMTKQLEKLYSLKKKGVDPNTLLTIAGNVAIATMVLHFEKTGVITTKLLPFLAKR